MRPERLKLMFPTAVILMAAAAFTVTLMWPRPDEAVLSSDTAGTTQARVPATTSDFRCDIAYVNDGDTLRCADGTRVRLHAIAARETDNSCSPGHPCPSASASASKSALIRLTGRQITCEPIGTSHQRVTAICWNSAGVEINCAMVRSGAAALWDRFNRQEPICQ